MKNYTIEEQDRIGRAIAELLYMRRDTEHSRRFKTTWGMKTGIGVFNVVLRLAEGIRTGEIKSSLGIGAIQNTEKS